MLSWLPHSTLVPVAIKIKSVIGMEAQAVFPDLSCHIWEEPREPLSFHCLLQQIAVPFMQGECSKSTVDTSLVTFDPIYSIHNIQCARVHSL